MSYRTTIYTRCDQCTFSKTRKAVLTEAQLQWAREHSVYTERCPECKCKADGCMKIEKIVAVPIKSKPNKQAYVPGIRVPDFWRYKAEREEG